MRGQADRLRGESGGGWRALGLFWGGLLATCLAATAVLEVLGPPQPPPYRPPPPPRAAVVAQGGMTRGGITGPQATLLEPDPADLTHMLPRVAQDGRVARVIYAARAPAPAGMARVGLILAGFGLNHPESEAALRGLPAGVTLAVSPYSGRLDGLLAAARASNHEYLLSIPMEPDGGPLNDAGDHALLTSVPTSANLARLDWVLSRLQGYVGTTDLLVGRLRGARFTRDAEAAAPVLDALGRRGLAYAGAEPDGAGRPGLWARRIDLLVDQDGDAGAIDARLADLVTLAQRDGAALGAAGAVTPVMVERIDAWAKGLAAKHVVLVPVSALVTPPSGTAR